MCVRVHVCVCVRAQVFVFVLGWVRASPIKIIWRNLWFPNRTRNKCHCRAFSLSLYLTLSLSLSLTLSLSLSLSLVCPKTKNNNKMLIRLSLEKHSLCKYLMVRLFLWQSAQKRCCRCQLLLGWTRSKNNYLCSRLIEVKGLEIKNNEPDMIGSLKLYLIF